MYGLIYFALAEAAVLASFMKVADQALILESNGAISVLPNPSQVTLSADFIGQLRSSSTAIQSTTMEVGPGPRSTAMTDPEFGEDESIIQRVDWALYRYFLAPTSMWKVIIGLIFVALGVANELSMGELAGIATTRLPRD